MGIYSLHQNTEAVYLNCMGCLNFVCLIFLKHLARSKHWIRCFCHPPHSDCGWPSGCSHAREGFPSRSETSRMFRLSSSSWHAFCQVHLQTSPGSWCALPRSGVSNYAHTAASKIGRPSWHSQRQKQAGSAPLQPAD